MMNTLRNAVSGWTAKILLGLLVVSFAVWGIGGAVQQGVASSVLTVGDTDVSLQDYAFAYSRAQARLAEQIQRRPTSEEMQMFGIDQGVLSQLVAGAVLDNQGKHIGLGLSKDRLAERIASDPTFRDASGNFSRSAFNTALANARITEQDYIRNQEEAAVRSQIVDAVSQGVKPPLAFDRAMGLYQGERRTVDYVSLSPEPADKIEDPSNDVLTKYFEDNKAAYAAPEYRGINYAVLTPEALADPSTVTDEQIKADYEQYKDRYTTPEKRHVRQIVFPDKAAADAAKTKLDGGASFAEIAKDAGRSMADIDLGNVTKSSIPDPKIADAAFSLKSGDISGVVDGTFGPAILAVDEIVPGSTKPLSEVSGTIRQALALESAADTASSAYNAFEDARAGGATFAEAAKTAAVPVKPVAAVSEKGITPDGQPVTDLPAQQDLLKGAFQAEPGFDNLPINYQSNGYVFYDVANIDPAHDRPLDEVKDKVVADWKRQEADRLLGEKVELLETDLKAGKSMQDVAAKAGAEVQTAPSITRQTGAADLGQAGITAAFSGSDGTIATAAGREPRSQLLIKVTEVAPPADPMANVDPKDRQQMAESFKNDLLESYVTLLQSNTTLAVHPAGIEQAKAMVR